MNEFLIIPILFIAICLINLILYKPNKKSKKTNSIIKKYNILEPLFPIICILLVLLFVYLVVEEGTNYCGIVIKEMGNRECICTSYTTLTSNESNITLESGPCEKWELFDVINKSIGSD